MSKSLDFLIIGAQKAGTTTLFKLLSEHPDIYMPQGKEVPFFNIDEAYATGLDGYLREFFGGASPHRLWGKATPHYLCDLRVADRIAATLPKVKLIAILREPADRALSHYRMSFRRGLESRTFEQAVNDMLAPGSLRKARKLPAVRASESQTYVVWGEYGRLLDAYYSRFPQEQLLVVFTDELKAAPEVTVNGIFQFLDMPSYRPHSLGRRFHGGGTRERLPWARRFAGAGPVRGMWHAVPRRLRSPVTYWFHQFNTVRETDSLDNHDPLTVQRLRDHYCQDELHLESLIGRPVSWQTGDRAQ